MKSQLKVTPRSREPAQRHDGDDSLEPKTKQPKRDGSTALVNRARSRQVCRFWVEKMVVLCDAMQIYALVWQLAQPWPWPARWLKWTRWVNAFNLDAFSFRATGAAIGATSQPFSLWGEMQDYWVYALGWAIVPSCGWIAFRIAVFYGSKSGRRDYLVARMQWENLLLQIYQFLYLPIGLAVLRLVNCDATGVVSVDPVAVGVCWSARHSVAVFFITVCLGGSFLVGFPWMLHKRIHRYVAQPNDEKHDRFVRAKELEFILGTSETYLDLHMPLYASFHRHSVRLPVDACVLKLVLLLVFALLRSPFPSKTNQGLQGTLFVVAISAFSIKRTFRPPFRVDSSSRLAKIVDWGLVSNGIFVLLCANGVRSALTVSTTMTSCLSFVNICFLIVLGLSVLHNFQEWGNRLNSRASTTECWPTNERMEAIVGYGFPLSAWVDAIQHAKAALLKALLVTPSMRSHEELGAVLHNLETCRDEALHSNHLLADQLAELLLYVNEIYVEALSSNPFHRTKFPENELSQLSRTLKRRDEHQTLRSSRSRRVLSKLQMTAAWKKESAAGGRQAADEVRDGDSLRSLFGDSPSLHSAAAAVVKDWMPVNALFKIRYTHAQPSDPHLHPVLLNVLRWSQESKLIQARLEPSGQNEAPILASLRDMHKVGVQLELVACGELQPAQDAVRALQLFEAELSQTSGMLHPERAAEQGDAETSELEQLMLLTEATTGLRQFASSMLTPS